MISKDWSERMAKAEDGGEIGAGSPDHPLRQRKLSFDPRCFDLAEMFLPHASVVVKSELAQDIQDAIESFLGDLESRTQQAWK